MDSKTIIPIEIRCNRGSTDVNAFFHIYKDEKVPKTLPKYLSMRLIEKGERKKIFDEAKAQKTERKAAKFRKGQTKEIVGKYWYG